MKYIRTYENKFKDSLIQPQVGDYVITKFDDIFTFSEWSTYLNNTIGQIVEIKIYTDGTKHFIVKYYVLDYIYDIMFKDSDEKRYLKYEGNKKFITVHLDECTIEEYSSNKKDLKIKLAAKKYNI